MTWKLRLTEAGLHLFDRVSGLNVLVDEIRVSEESISRSPRYLSVALTNACELRCAYCYAPKRRGVINPTKVIDWAIELDREGCLGIGFGGGEPTAHPNFAELCVRVAESTSMAVTFTTHGHRMTPSLADALRGSVHFVRLSVDGVGGTYERLRGRAFSSVRVAADLLRSIAPIGINTVVNRDTIGELDDIVEFAAEVGASELLLLPEQPTLTTRGITDADADHLTRWIRTSSVSLRLAISRSGLEWSVPAVDVLPGEDPMDAHLHIDASGVLRPNAYASAGVPVGDSILEAIRTLKEEA